MLIVVNAIYYGAIKWEMLAYNSDRLSHHNIVYPLLYNNSHLVDDIVSPTYSRELIKR